MNMIDTTEWTATSDKNTDSRPRTK